MIKQLFALVWNRRRANFLVVLEIFACFLVLFAVSTLTLYYADNFSKPLGFSFDNVWAITLSTESVNGGQGEEIVPGETRCFKGLQEIPEIEAAASIYQAPYMVNWSTTQCEYKGRKIHTTQNGATDDLIEVLQLELTQGRWFREDDDALNWEPVVINERLKEELFGTEDPVGKAISLVEYEEPKRVVGVITDFRKDGEFSGLENYLFTRMRLGQEQFRSRAGTFLTNQQRIFLVRLRPGTSRAFAETLAARLHKADPALSFEIEPLSEVREFQLRLWLAPVVAAVIVVTFLVIMVGLGLVGIVWQSVTQRTTEIGLRRALGAASGNIYTQVLGELLVISSVGLGFGAILVLQLPILNVIGFINLKVYIYSLGLSIVFIQCFTLLCGLYPSWLATRIHPVEALHWE